MRVSSVLLLALWNTMVAGHIDDQETDPHDHVRLGCGTPNANAEYKKQDAIAMKQWKAKQEASSYSSTLRQRSSLCDGCNNIDVYFHVLEIPDIRSRQFVLTDQVLENQFRVLQEKFEGTPFRFTYKGVDRLVNRRWATYDYAYDEDFTAMVGRELGIGGPDVLNVYWSDGICNSVGGIATLPYYSGAYPVNENNPIDVVLMCNGVVAGAEEWYEGKLLVHEVGHWLGLLHTYEGSSCSASNHNDLVDDTPQQATRSQGCPMGRDSCSNHAGLDPIHNYMDATWEECQDHFTPGQIERMYAQYDMYRRPNRACHPNLEAKFEIEILMDQNANRETNFFVLDLLSFYTIEYMADPATVDFRNKLVRRTVCIDKQRAYEFDLYDSKSNGIQSPGYYKLFLNDREVASGGDFDREGVYYFVSGDRSACAATQRRFLLELVMDNESYETEWSLINTNTNQVVVNYLSSVTPGDSYYSNGYFPYNPLFVDHCLDAGSYRFTITDSGGNGIQSPGHYRVYLGNQLKKQGGDFEASDSVTFQVRRRIVACFAGNATVLVQGRGPVAMQHLRLGDRVLVSSEPARYEPVYSFGHRHPSLSTEFLVIHTNLTVAHNPLRISATHMIALTDKRFVPASGLHVGDLVQTSTSGQPAQVLAMETRVYNGAFAPFTPSGTVVVDGVVCSSYVSVQNSEYWMLGSMTMPLSHHWLAHASQSAHRLWCLLLGHDERVCANESYSATEGLSNHIVLQLRATEWLLDQHVVVMTAVLIPIVAILVVLLLLESLISYCGVWQLLLLATLGGWWLLHNRIPSRAKGKLE